MIRTATATAALLLAALPGAAFLAAGPAAAQAHGMRHHPTAGQPPAIKGLTPEQMADLRAGRGMGLALPAEANGYPGPVHVLELADRLALTPEQKARTEALVQAMKGEAIPLGARLIEQEAALDRLFAERRATPDSIKAAVGSVAATQAELRTTHLKYHLTMTDLLTPEQIRTYQDLRRHSGKHPGQ